MSSKYDGILAEFYDLDHQWRDYQAQAEFVRSLLEKGHKVLDLCCGSGSHAVLLAQQGLKVVGVDQSDVLLEQARKKCAGDTPMFLNHDVFGLGDNPEFIAGFDAVTLLGWTLSIESIYKRFSELLEVAVKVLKPGGLFVFDAAMGAHFNPVTQEAMEYEHPSGMRGKVRIKLKEGGGNVMFVYDWQIWSPDSQSEINVRAEEVLRITELDEVFSEVQKFSNQFEIMAKLGDYDMDQTFKKGDGNLVMALKKQTFHPPPRPPISHGGLHPRPSRAGANF